VVLNVTATVPTKAGYFTGYPNGASLPFASDLNFLAGQTVANLVVVKVGTTGAVNVFNRTASTHVVIDVVGWSIPREPNRSMTKVGSAAAPLRAMNLPSLRIGNVRRAVQI
jgi:hypothetical protein